ncbi:carbohydrate kinase [Paenibacillus sp. TRM 82003]|uniref:carbohydrate kinase family protein n=1 Tax=Kineococcus sp. TRM81007 TaxID=2925831 RepID=UPI001F5AC046|nr:carbohydrate kinase [Kineococcus sp. TRM81007]MCI2239141.1 carbohydrate kinase [Kineococcus sp. TRM81007]MCI3924820.1 carbohydrate kinase [Paenibacillus sp. TRM 82003]
MRTRALVVGESLVDVVRAADGAESVHPGGSPLNVAYGLGRLGHEVSLLTRLGDDAHGHLLREHLAAGGVGLAPGAVDELPTSVARAQLDEQGRASYEFELRWRLPTAQVPDGVDVMHTGSIGAAVDPGARQALELLRSCRERATTSYDPNVRPAFLGAPERARVLVEEFVEAADVVKASDEDVAWLFPGEDPVEVARRWQRRGPALVVVTRGGEGAVGVAGAGTLRVPTPPTRVVDTVGAGDAFTSGLLHALAEHDLLGPVAARRLRALRLDALEDVLRTAARVASITCSRAGANPPTREELAAG